jgi:hypothetical protein
MFIFVGYFAVSVFQERTVGSMSGDINMKERYNFKLKSEVRKMRRKQQAVNHKMLHQLHRPYFG